LETTSSTGSNPRETVKVKAGPCREPDRRRYPGATMAEAAWRASGVEGLWLDCDKSIVQEGPDRRSGEQDEVIDSKW